MGKEALLKEVDNGPRKVFASMVIDCDIAAAHSGDPVFFEDKLVGSITSGDYGHRVRKNIAYALVDPEYNTIETKLSVDILGEKYQAEVCTDCLYDEEYKLVRS